jgi:hypothetical protein
VAALNLPPPKTPVDPTRLTKLPLKAGTTLIRVYDPKSKYKPGPRSFRANGPRGRFDHHRGTPYGTTITPSDDPDRAVYYAAFTLSSAVVEVFGEDRVIDRGTFRVVYSTLEKELLLLDLRGDAAIRAGTIHAIGQVEDTVKTQAWSRYIYENVAIYGNVDGLIYANAHNGEDAILFYERAQAALNTSDQRVRRLAAHGMEAALLRIADATGFVLV